MITRIEAQGYKCLFDVDVELSPFNVLVGPNASGKSTLLDAIGFLQDALRMDGDVTRAVRKRARQLPELTWRGERAGFSLEIGARVPREVGAAIASGRHLTQASYTAMVGARPDGPIQLAEVLHAAEKRTLILDELLARLSQPANQENGPEHPSDLLREGYRVSLLRVSGKPNLFLTARGEPWRYKPPPERLALSLVPEDPDQFPEALWFRGLLRDRVHMLELNSAAMRQPCPPDAPRELRSDGSNLPFLVQQIEGTDRFAWWIEHLQTVLHGLETIQVIEQPHDRHLYLLARFAEGLEVPSWRLSDGTLRFLALTLIAYLPPEDRIFIIEEPENGIHPKAIEAVIQSLTSVYEGQVFLATHSPVVVGLTPPENLLCFSQDEEGATQIVRGSEHPELQEWRKGVPLSDLFAAGVLG